LDRSESGIAAGVGQARIVGKIRNVICAFGEGHLEFEMDFITLQNNDRLLLLGLDQMRKYKCIVNLESEKIVFGGEGGLELPLLPPSHTHPLRRSIQCPVS